MSEILTCPNCGNVITSTKSESLPDSTVATCKVCELTFSLGSSRAISPRKQSVTQKNQSVSTTVRDVPTRQMVATQVVVNHESNSLGTAAFVTSILGIITLGVLSPVSLVLSLIALRGKPKGMAAAGVTLSTIGCAPWLFFIALRTRVIQPDLDFSTQNAQYATVEFDLHGVRIGETLSTETIERYEIQLAPERGQILGYEKLILDDAEISIHYGLIDKKVESIVLLFESTDFDTLRMLFERKFGPATVSTETLQNGFGAKFENVKLSWQTKSGEFTCEKYSGKLTQGYASIYSEKALDSLVDDADAKERELMKKL